MEINVESSAPDFKTPEQSRYIIFESLDHPVCILGIDGTFIYGNSAFSRFFRPSEKGVHLAWEHPFFPEYRKRISLAYLSAIKGTEKQCFAMINSSEGKQLPVEIYLYPMYENESVISILALMKIVDERLLSFDRSTLSIISEDNFHYDSLHFEFSPMPIIRVDDKFDILKCSHSAESFFGYGEDEVPDKCSLSLQSLFPYDAERIKKAISGIISGENTFQRIGETKISTGDNEKKLANLILYPVIQNNEISAVEIIIEDITALRDLKDQINTMHRIQLLSDITKGFLHSLNNTVNVIMSKTQLLLQITEKESVLEGIHLIEESVSDLVDQTRRIQDFIALKGDAIVEKVEPLVNIIEDAIEFAKMQFKVEDKEKRRSINIERKYFTSVHIKTDTRLLREIVISIILKVANFLLKKGTLHIELKSNHDICLTVHTSKDENAEQIQPVKSIYTFSGVNIREIAEKINIKIIEEESVGSYSLKAFFPPRMIQEKKARDNGSIEYKIRDLDIIVVEDEISLQKILYEVFDRMGNRVFICENGQEALEEFKSKHYDLVVTDYGVAGLTGIELAAKIKELNEKVPTVLLSGWMLEDMTSYKNVIDLFLPKPFRLQDLLKGISRLFTEKGRTD
ncbi:MAG TPA: response regulator [Spirochaetota bacterium]|nr:response regulator [Spirochaetota bacterium]HPI88674.1 response regulator [Spirochaetota bacterium]HPR49115.1 response regulator [Spirochaetota bacterium]